MYVFCGVPKKPLLDPQPEIKLSAAPDAIATAMLPTAHQYLVLPRIEPAKGSKSRPIAAAPASREAWSRAAFVAAVWIVIVKLTAEAPTLTVCGLKLTVAPGGSPVAESTTGKLSGPEIGWIIRPYCAGWPGNTVWVLDPDGLDGFGTIVKSAFAINSVIAAEVLPAKFASPE